MSDNTIINFNATESGLIEYQIEAAGYGEMNGIMQLGEAKTLMQELQESIDNADSDGWDPSDGAGYIPTEEGGNGREEPITHEIFGETVSVCQECGDVIGGEYRLCENCGKDDPLTEALEELEQEAQEIADNPERRQTQAYANGVCAGIKYAVEELREQNNE